MNIQFSQDSFQTFFLAEFTAPFDHVTTWHLKEASYKLFMVIYLYVKYKKVRVIFFYFSLKNSLKRNML